MLTAVKILTKAIITTFKERAEPYEHTLLLFFNKELLEVIGNLEDKKIFLSY